MKVFDINIVLASYCGEGNGTPLQYSCLENPMDWGAWWAAVHGVAKSQTRLSDFTFTFRFHALEKEMAFTLFFLENPRDGGAWWAAVNGVTQSRTWLKWLSSSSRTIAYQAPPSMGFSRQEYWSGLPFPSPGDLPDPGIEPGSPTFQADALSSEPPGKPRRAEYCTYMKHCYHYCCYYRDRSTQVLTVVLVKDVWVLSLFLSLSLNATT